MINNYPKQPEFKTTETVTNNLADVLERVLDKGIVIAGDIKIQIADIDLLNIKIRLLITSVDKAEEIGLDWWRADSFLSSQTAKKIKSTKINTKGSKRSARK